MEGEEGRDLVETSCLGLSVARSLTFCILSGMGLCICSLLLQEVALVRTAEQGTDLNVIGSRFIAVILFFITVVFGPRSLE